MTCRVQEKPQNSSREETDKTAVQHFFANTANYDFSERARKVLLTMIDEENQVHTIGSDKVCIEGQHPQTEKKHDEDGFGYLVSCFYPCDRQDTPPCSGDPRVQLQVLWRFGKLLSE